MKYYEGGRFLIAVPYEPVRDLREWRRRVWMHSVGYIAMGMTGMAALLAALWEARIILLGLAITLASVAWVVSRANHRGACPGLHCSGCRG